MEMRRIQGLHALFFDNLEKTLQKLVWKYMKFYTIDHYITSFTIRQIFTMNCQNTSLKCKKKFKQIYSCIIYSKIWKKIIQIGEKVY